MRIDNFKLALALVSTALGVAFALPVPATAQTVSAAPPQLPLKDFFRNPALNDVRISPDGAQLALLKPWKKRMNVFLRTVAEPHEERQLTFVADRDIVELRWKGSNYILFTRDFGGDENFLELDPPVESRGDVGQRLALLHHVRECVG